MTVVREHYDRKSGQWVQGPRVRRYAAGNGPTVISDSLPDLMNHADGQRYDSKRAFERAVRNAGCEIVGNEQQRVPERVSYSNGEVGRDVKRAIEQLRSR